MFERAHLHVLLRRSLPVEDSCVADSAVVRDHLAAAAYVLPVMAPEAPGRIQMADVVRVRLPVGPHLREKVLLIDLLDSLDGSLYLIGLLRKNVGIIRPVKIVDA